MDTEQLHAAAGQLHKWTVQASDDAYDSPDPRDAQIVLAALDALLPFAPLLEIITALEASQDEYWVFTCVKRDASNDYSFGAGYGDGFSAKAAPTWQEALSALASKLEEKA